MEEFSTNEVPKSPKASQSEMQQLSKSIPGVETENRSESQSNFSDFESQLTQSSTYLNSSKGSISSFQGSLAEENEALKQQLKKLEQETKQQMDVMRKKIEQLELTNQELLFELASLQSLYPAQKSSSRLFESLPMEVFFFF